MGFAALLGEGVYNFGELLAHPILQSLNNSAEQWIAEVDFIFNFFLKYHEKIFWKRLKRLNVYPFKLLELERYNCVFFWI